MAKKNLPPLTISKGSVVRYKDWVGVVSGDHTSPGGMQGHFIVAFTLGVVRKEGIEFVTAFHQRLIQLPAAELEAVQCEAVLPNFEEYLDSFSKFLERITP